MRLFPREDSTTEETENQGATNLDLLPAEILPMDRRQADDIYLASYPKSGNTWCQTCMAALAYGLDIPRVPNSLVQTLIPGIHNRKGHYVRFQSPTIFKTHALPQPEYRRVIYILRDGRDAVTSYYHFIAHGDRRPKRLVGRPRDEDWQWILERGSFGRILWHEHVRAWRENPHGAEILMIRYEDMKADPVRILGQMAEFVGIERTREQLEHVAEITTFASMKERENRFRARKPNSNSTEVVRRGSVGSYRDEMPPQVLERFEEMAGQTLREMGYAA